MKVHVAMQPLLGVRGLSFSRDGSPLGTCQSLLMRLANYKRLNDEMSHAGAQAAPPPRLARVMFFHDKL